MAIMHIDEVIGHQFIKDWFKDRIQKDTLPKVTMLYGPAGLGKTSIAKVVACEIACKTKPEQLDSMKKTVILDNESTDSVKLYNMSNLYSQDEVDKVKADLTVGFSSTGRKVIIMDEAHGMNDKAQDSLLTSFESLPDGVFIIICTTEINSFRDAFISRCILRRFSLLSSADMKKLITGKIRDKKLTFDMPTANIAATLSIFTGREPRRVLNLLDTFEDGYHVSNDELETFLSIEDVDRIVYLLRYMMEGNVFKCIEFCNEIRLSESFGSVLLEIVLMLLGKNTNIIPKKTQEELLTLVSETGKIKDILTFTSNVLSTKRLTNNLLVSYVIKAVVVNREPYVGNNVLLQDLAVMKDNIEIKSEGVQKTSQSLDEFFDGLSKIDNN